MHIVPRDEGDGLVNFDIPSNDISQSDMLPVLKGNLQKMLGITPKPQAVPGQPTGQSPAEGFSNDQKKQLAQAIEQNPWLKKMLIENPEEVKKGLDSNPEVKKMFEGVDINALSKKLQEIEGVSETKKEVVVEDKKEEEVEVIQPPALKGEEKKVEAEEEKPPTPPPQYREPETTSEKEDEAVEEVNKEEDKSTEKDAEEEIEKENSKEEKKNGGLLDKVSDMFT